MRYIAKFVAGIALLISTAVTAQDANVRARHLGIEFDGTAGPLNAITDIPGVLVGQTTLIEGQGPRAVRTGVTAILPRKELGYYPAGVFVLNGDAELSGAIFAEEFGMLRSPIMLTGTASNGTVFTSVIKWSLERHADNPVYMPVVADTWDADLSDAFSFPLKESHVRQALDAAKSGPVAEGNVGGGTGMVCFGFKGGIGTASRRFDIKGRPYTVGVLVQCNQGFRAELRAGGRRLGKEISDLLPDFRQAVSKKKAEADGSIIIVVGTDAPLNSTTLKALGRRAAMGLARTGAVADSFSGDIVITFSTARIKHDPQTYRVETEAPLFQYAAGPLYTAAIQATEEAVINSMIAARTMRGLHGSTVHSLPHDRVRELYRLK
ncbi:MAG TPA: P1 family peptidase [Sphingomicrobium sp.]|nr:P1 family peptidase [Sphingomicrobium sp.]